MHKMNGFLSVLISLCIKSRVIFLAGSFCLASISYFNSGMTFAKSPLPPVLSVTDFSGRVVSLSHPAKRIIALAPHITENVFSAGAGDLLVGTVNYSDYPEAAKAILQVGSPHSFSVETVIDLNPDLVIVWSSGVSEKVTKQLIALGLTVYMDEPRQLEDIAKSINDIGVLSDRQAVSRQASQQFLAHLTALKKNYSQRSPISLFYQIWNSPLMTLNGQHIISDVIRLCGGVNVFSDAVAIAPKLSVESVLHLDPQVIVASGMGQERPEWLDQWQQWKNLIAVKNQHLFFIHPDILQRHTVRILQGAEILCEQLEQVRTANQ
jgi:iron complex transport system substrate-binding protein